MINFDFWYGNKQEDIALIDYSFSDLDCMYRGNMYDINGRMIGDYSTSDSAELESLFPGVFGE